MMQLFRASADLYETDNEVVAKFDLPGVRREDINVEIENGSLVVSVEKTGEREVRKESTFFMERAYSGYFRSIPLPAEADQENVRADYEDGVLTVRFPLIEGAGGRRSSIGAGPEGSPISGRRPSEIIVSRPAFSSSTAGRGLPSALSPHQERISRDEMMRQGTDSPLYRSGTGTYYSDTFERPSGEAAPESYFGRGASNDLRIASVSQREAEVARREAEVARREAETVRTGSQVPAPSSPAPYQPRLSREEMIRQGTDSPIYRSGSGSYYSDTFERPTGEAAPESSFGRRVGVSPEGERRRGSRIKTPPER